MSFQMLTTGISVDHIHTVVVEVSVKLFFSADRHIKLPLEAQNPLGCFPLQKVDDLEIQYTVSSPQV
jgi:hypothetical protein